MILDDLKYIHAKDSGDAFGFAVKQILQLKERFTCLLSQHSFDNVVVAGMGGSALGALFSQSWPQCTVPLAIWHRYDAPTYLSERSLCIISSYSGNTEESLSALETAIAAKANIVIISGGGTLADKARAQGYPLLPLPETPQPRFGTFASFMAMLAVLEGAGLTNEKAIFEQVTEAAKMLEQAVTHWLLDVPAKDNPAKQLALELAGTTPIIYAGERMFPAAYKWKLGFNESAKNLAWCGEIPEFCHNEFTGWTSHPIEKAFSVVDLYSLLEHPQVQKRFELSERLLSGKRPHPHRVEAQGKNVVEHMLYLSLFGDFVSLYVAILNGVDPTPLPYVDKLKNALS